MEQMSESSIIDVHDPIVRQAYYIVFNGVCFYTGRPITIKNMHIDHVLPKCLGGKSTVDNLVLCCQEINLRKREKYSDHFGSVVREIINLVFSPAIIKTIEDLTHNSELKEMSCLNDRLRERGIPPYSALGRRIGGRVMQRSKCKIPNIRRGKKIFFRICDLDQIIDKALQC